MIKKIAMIIILMSVIFFITACQPTISDYQITDDGILRFDSLIFLDENQKNASFFMTFNDDEIYLVRFSDDDDDSLRVSPITIEGNYTIPIYIDDVLSVNSRYGGYLIGTFQDEKTLISLTINREFLTGHSNGTLSLSPLDFYDYVSYRWILSAGIPNYVDGEISYYDQTMTLLDVNDWDAVYEILTVYDGSLYYIPDLFDESSWFLIEEKTDVTSGVIYKGRYNTLNVSIIDEDDTIVQCYVNDYCSEPYHINEEVIAHKPIFQKYMPGKVPFILVETETRFIILNETQSLISVVAKAEGYKGYHVYVTGDGGYLAQYQIIDGYIERTLHRVVNLNDI